MKWVKKGRIFSTEHGQAWMRTHAQLPTVDKVDDEKLRIYFSTRNNVNVSFTTYLDVMADDPSRVIYVHDKPILDLGALGCFDDSGIMPSCIVRHNDQKYLYYVGWNRGVSVRYRVSGGLAVCGSRSSEFRKISNGPVLDRNLVDPYAIGNVAVMIENDIWKMWYMSYCKWTTIGGVTEPFYVIKYAESPDGIAWNRQGIICVDFKNEWEAGIARPTVIKEDGLYRMWYSTRGSVDYRKDSTQSYRIGYAESSNGINWIRKDEEAGIGVSEEGWDSEMIAYPCVYKHKGRTYMFYNGNGFGQSGFGYAVLV